MKIEFSFFGNSKLEYYGIFILKRIEIHVFYADLDSFFDVRDFLSLDFLIIVEVFNILKVE